MVPLVAPVPGGRVHEGSAVVRLGDSSPGGRLRLDAAARHVQDVADDDARAAGLGDATWVVRRTVLSVHRFPVYLEALRLRTWCSGVGAAWAERRVSIEGERGGSIESATLWVHVDPRTLRPARLTREFLDVFGPSASGRRVSASALLDPAPDGTGTGAPVTGTPWPLRFTDFDVLEHMNNAAYLAPVEEALASRRALRAPMTVVLEHGEPVERGDEPQWVVVERSDGGFDGWLVEGGRQFAAVSVAPSAGEAG